MPARIAMEVTVRWLTRDSEDVVKRVFEALDAAGYVGPTDWVSQSIHQGAIPLDRDQIGVHEGDFEVVVEGPAHWTDVFRPQEAHSGPKLSHNQAKRGQFR